MAPLIMGAGQLSGIFNAFCLLTTDKFCSTALGTSSERTRFLGLRNLKTILFINRLYRRLI